MQAMTQATVFNHVMMAIWDEGRESPEWPMEATAIAAYLKTFHRVNVEDAMAVLRIIWKGAKVSARVPDTQDDPSEVWYDVTMPDGSQALLISKMGECSGIELL